MITKSPYIDKLIKETGKQSDEIIKLWNKVIELTEESYGIKHKEFKNEHFKYARETVYNILGKREHIDLVPKFVESEKSTKEFIKEYVQSGDFPGLYDDPIVKGDEEETRDVETEYDIDRKSKQMDFDTLDAMYDYPMDEKKKTTKKTKVIKKKNIYGDEVEESVEVEEAKKDGTEPDSTGPHGRGDGPGKGKADGSGMKKKDDEEKESKKQSTTEELKSLPIKHVYETQNKVILEVSDKNGKNRYIRFNSLEEARENGWNVD
jgi:hypothetical protein